MTAATTTPDTPHPVLFGVSQGKRCETTNRTGGDGGGSGGEEGPVRERDLVLDVVRAGALLVVVSWHWAFTTLRWDDGPRIGNPIGETPGMWLATWFLQVMPLFFLVGGALHAVDRRRDGDFIRNRFRRLVPPAVAFLAIAAGAAGIAGALGRADLVRGVVLMITPLWFLGVYLTLVLLVPVARRAHRRLGLWAVAAGVVAVALVDRIWVLPSRGAIAVLPMLAIYALTWSVVHQLGFHLGALRAAPRAAKWATCLGGFALLGFGAVRLGYPASMVGSHGDPISNMSPPNLMVVFLAIAQMGLLTVAEPVLARWADRHRELIASAGAWSMTVYVWHMLALAGFWGLVVTLSGTVDHTVDGSWWMQRPMWLLGPLLFAVPLFAVAGPGRSRRLAVVSRRMGVRLGHDGSDGCDS